MKIYDNPPTQTWQQICKRTEIKSDNLESLIAEVFKRVGKDGDKALIEYTEKFDKVILSEIQVKSEQLKMWGDKTPDKLKSAINTAYNNIWDFHKAQLASLGMIEAETLPGVRCWREARPIERIGIYIPGGSAPLFSTVLMLGIPAKLAGCKEIVLCTPPAPDGTINPAICYAISLIGIKTVLRVGGSQAIAAMSLGTESVPKVDKIFGPGNQYVTAAKLYCGRYGVAFDMPAGPSEVMVIADESAIPDFVAADLLSQAEHAPDSQVVLVAKDISIVKAVEKSLAKQLVILPRKEVAEKALKNSFCVIIKDIEKTIQFANTYAPEHLILSVENAEKVASEIQNAGSVFIGNYSPESAGDYASGTNHTLPTNGWAKSYSGLSVENFCKYITFQSISKNGAKLLAPTVMIMAEAEGLDAHKRAMKIRL